MSKKIEKNIVSILRAEGYFVTDADRIVKDLTKLATQEKPKPKQYAILTEEELWQGCTCPSCGQHAEIYPRNITESMADALFKLYKMDKLQPHKIFFHYDQELKLTNAQSADFSKFAHWKLIRKKAQEETDDPNKKSSGYWAITDRGKRFVEGDFKIDEIAVLYNNELLGFLGEKITVHDTVGVEFDYRKLMSGEWVDEYKKRKEQEKKDKGLSKGKSKKVKGKRKQSIRTKFSWKDVRQVINSRTKKDK